MNYCLYLILGLLLFGCKYKPVITTLQKKDCTELQTYLAKNWRVHQSKHLYQCKQPEALVAKFYEYRESCFFTLTFEEVQQLLGKPNKSIGNGYLIYHISPLCSNEFKPCKVISISFNHSTGKPLYIDVSSTNIVN